jgi:hypothetical protein
MSLLTKTLFLLAAAAVAVAYEGAHLLRTAPTASVEPTVMEHVWEAAHDFAPPSGSWESLFSASWR